MAEVVHCKSRGEAGVALAAPVAAGVRVLGEPLPVGIAGAVVARPDRAAGIMGETARRVLRGGYGPGPPVGHRGSGDVRRTRIMSLLPGGWPASSRRGPG